MIIYKNIRLIDKVFEFFVCKPNNSIDEGIKKSINLSIPDSKTKLYLILDAEKLCFPNQEAANSLLKILEEPNENHLFILVTSNINKIIDTITSRCIPIYFNNIEENKLKDYIIESSTIDNDKAKIISRICMGNMRYAQELINTYEDRINLIQELIIYLKDNKPSKWNDAFKKMNRNITLEILNLLIIFFKDLKVLQKNDDTIHLTDCYKLYNSFLTTFSNINCEASIKLISNCQNYIQRNGYQNLMMMSLFLELKNILRKEKNLMFNINEWTLYSE